MSAAPKRSLEELLAAGQAQAVDAPADDPRRIATRRAIVERWGFGLPQRTAELVIHDRLFSTRALEVAKAWVAGPREVLVEIGSPGTGKSTACTWATLEREAEGPVVYLLESQLAEWLARRTRYEEELEGLRTAGTVVIDEVGRTEGRMVELARIGVAEVVHQRLGVVHVKARELAGAPSIRRRRRTILQGNLTLDDMAERFDPRFLDRLEEVGTLVHTDGPSLRGRR